MINEEVAFIAYHFHWDRDRIMKMEHSERRMWAKEISNINLKINEEKEV